MREILIELYQIIFIGAIIYMLYTITNLFIKAYGFFKLKNEDITFSLSSREKIILWISISIFISYLIK